MEQYTVAFFGHRFIDNTFEAEEQLRKLIGSLLQEKPYVVFLVGRNGDFDQLVSSTVRRCKKRYRNDNNSLVLVLPYETAEYRNGRVWFEAFFDEIEISETASKAHPKSAIRIRNREMIDRANLIVCYVDRKNGGAFQAMQYALKTKTPVINLAENDTNR